MLDFRYDLILLGVIDKMVVAKKLVMEDIYEKLCVSDKAANHTRIWEVRIAHGVIV